METTDILFALLRHAVCGQELDEETKKACTPENLEAVYTLAKKHDLAHLVAHAVEGLDIPPCEVLTKLKNVKMRAIYRYARMDLEFERLCQALEEAQIPFIPLKGSMLRQYYPQPWMRTSCDIDILVKEVDLKKTTDVLSKGPWSIRGEINHHDIHMQTESGVHLDLHYSIKGNIDAPDAILEQVWEYSAPAVNRQYEHKQTDEFFLFHLIAHASRHFLSEGCGIRPFLDIWLLRQKIVWNQSVLQKWCEDAHLEVFWLRMIELSDVWFGAGKHSQTTEKMEHYIVHRDKQTQLNNSAIFKKVRKNQSAHWGSRLFLSYELLKTTYPILEKHRWLTPVFQVVRWFKKLIDGRIRRLLHGTKKQANSADFAEAKAFLRDVGLDA